MRSVLDASGWRVVHARVLPGRAAGFLPVGDLPLSPPAKRALAAFPEGVYHHQKRALQEFLDGRDVCLATGTASGKSLAFFIAGIDTLVRHPGSRILAVYPMKALAREQESRWAEAAAEARLAAGVGRIDGSVAQHEREEILDRCDVVLMTPDVIHAWLLSSVSQAAVRRFLARVRLLVVDEVHVYTGVFGSNAAFLFRRLFHAADALSRGAPVRCLGASATVAAPASHLRSLFARDFQVIPPEEDTSPRHPLEVLLIRPPQGTDPNTAVAGLLQALARRPGERFIAFVDSRRQTELLATIQARRPPGEADDAATNVPFDVPPSVLPYRSGYEEDDRSRIQDRLARGELAGVISTSALELGLDIRGLSTAVLLGVPSTATSFQQRVGRVGRHAPGTVLIVNAGGVYDEIIFSEPERLFTRPLAQSALCLENRHIQYVHALCFAAPGGEYDALRGAAAGAEGASADAAAGPAGTAAKGAAEAAPGAPAEAAVDAAHAAADAADEEIATRIDWPEGFLDLCRRERAGAIPSDLQGLRLEAGNDPWHVYPLRDVGTQFEVELRSGGLERLGTLSFAQVMREAYPGAVYHYLARPYRVHRVLVQARKVVVKRERHYTTEPLALPVLIHAHLDGEGMRGRKRFGDLTVVEADLYISETVLGYEERRGNTVEEIRYPCQYWNRDRFSRNFFSTGVLLSHPALDRNDVQWERVARLLLEAFLLVVPFDRGDVAAGEGRFRQSRPGLAAGDRFIALYDQVYGSLRLTGRLMDGGTLRAVLREALVAARSGPTEALGSTDPAAVEVLEEIAAAVESPGEPLLPAISAPVPAAAAGAGRSTPAAWIAGAAPRVIMPGSAGWLLTEANQEFAVEGVFYHPKDGLRYRGRRAGERRSDGLIVSFPVGAVQPIPGVSRMGIYDYDSGEVRPLPS